MADFPDSNGNGIPDYNEPQFHPDPNNAWHNVYNASNEPDGSYLYTPWTENQWGNANNDNSQNYQHNRPNYGAHQYPVTPNYANQTYPSFWPDNNPAQQQTPGWGGQGNSNYTTVSHDRGWWGKVQDGFKNFFHSSSGIGFKRNLKIAGVALGACLLVGWIPVVGPYIGASVIMGAIGYAAYANIKGDRLYDDPNSLFNRAKNYMQNLFRPKDRDNTNGRTLEPENTVVRRPDRAHEQEAAVIRPVERQPETIIVRENPRVQVNPFLPDQTLYQPVMPQPTPASVPQPVQPKVNPFLPEPGPSTPPQLSQVPLNQRRAYMNSMGIKVPESFGESKPLNIPEPKKGREKGPEIPR